MANRGNTENLKSWKAGQSGNPAGKPKGMRNRSTIVRKWLEASATDGEEGQVADQLTRALIRKAAEGDVAAFRELMDSCYGKIKDDTDIRVFTMMPAITKNGEELIFNIGED